ncbi:uncharacterized protein LOC116341279 [Contarinia nasturtii]|uniref:uncharacterized protein LOC116341279 n=1 Tax=Contarinia nasturtii TaxID=265458 RepID=UPI0012D45D93|nr:uncharacterized protein LOC116341279 [Contarinia nasturtii]
MKSVPFSIFLSLFLILQVVNSEKLVSLLKKFNERTKTPKSKFNFLLKITNDIDVTKKNLEKIPTTFFLGLSVSEYILNKVPENLQIGEIDARTVLRGKFKAVNEAQTTTIKKLLVQICARIAFKSQGILGQNIEKSYKNWLKNPLDPDHLKQIDDDYSKMKSKFDEWQNTFIDEMQAADVLRDEIGAHFNAAVSIFKTLLKEPHEASKISENYVDGVLDSILKRQAELVKRLGIAAHVLQNYNLETIKWTEFLIGMRATLESDPKPVVGKNSLSRIFSTT